MDQVKNIPCINPATGEQFDEVAMSTPEDVKRAVEEMRQNVDAWRRTAPRARARALQGLQEALIEQADEITLLVNQDTGKSRQDALAELFMVVDKLKTYRKQAPKWLAPKRVSPGIYFTKRYHVARRPFGVAAIIGPWNYPLDLTLPPIFSALLAGNTVVLKPSEVTPAIGALIERIFRAIPELAPYVRVLHGDGAVGAALVDAGPDVIFLTGSVATGRKVAKAAAEKMIPFRSELGGKDPMIVLDDADIRAAARWGVWGAFVHAGQACVAVERVYVMADVYDRFLSEVLVETERLRHGYSSEAQNSLDLGPLTFRRQAQLVEDHLQDALAKGARILAGGRRDGLFMEPTVVTGVNHGMRLMREETFGPIMPIMKVRDEREAIRLANDSAFGLSASVWSEDLARAERVARALDVGSVVINDALAHYAVVQLPFGGMKQSGNTRTHGEQEVLQFTQIQAFAVGRAPGPLDVAARLREPGNYYLMRALFHALFGVNLRQRLRAAPDMVAHAAARFQSGSDGSQREDDARTTTARALAFAGGLAGLVMVIVATLRGR